MYLVKLLFVFEVEARGLDHFLDIQGVAHLIVTRVQHHVCDDAQQHSQLLSTITLKTVHYCFPFNV